MTVPPNRRRRDWGLIIFILPLGILLMLFGGQLAIRMAPSWAVQGEMKSYLDPNSAKKDAMVVAPISRNILTPASWWDTFLTPMADAGAEIVFPPFIVFDPTDTPTATEVASATSTEVTPTDTATATSTPASPTVTPTKKPPSGGGGGGGTPTPVPLCTDSSANNVGSPLPCTYPPTTCTDSAANNNGGPLPCIYPSPAPLVGSPTTVPANINVGAPNGTIGTIYDGTYVVINLSGNPIIVNGPSETNYDFVYYEEASGGGIQMDNVILSISQDNSPGSYYVVFNWGNNGTPVPDTNSNVGVVTSNTGTENDNQPIQPTDASPALYGPSQTGILIDVDNAPSNPPTGNYNYLAIQAPSPPVGPGTDNTIGMDAVQVTEVPP